MKKRSLITLLAMLLCLTMSLVACSSCSKKEEGDPDADSTPTTLESVYNSAWSYTSASLTSHKTLGDLGEYLKSSNSFVVFTDNNSSQKLTRVFSHFTDTVVKTFTDTNEETYHTYIPYASDNLIMVLKLEKSNSGYGSYNYSSNFGTSVNYQLDYQIELYDAKGTLVETYGKDEIEDSYINNIDGFCSNLISAGVEEDTVIIKNSLYTENADGTLTLVKTFDLTDIPEINMASESYYYQTDSTSVIVYDKNFNFVTYYEIPSYASASSINILNNGNVFVQYKVILPEDAAVYDYAVRTTKYDLTTLIISAADGAQTEIAANYVVEDIVSNFMFEKYYNDGDVAYCAASMENLACIRYINNQRLDENDAAADYVLLGNDGTVGASVKLRDDLDQLPMMIGNGLYSAETIDGSILLLNAKGEVILKVGDNVSSIGNYSYLYTDLAIYDVNGNVVYDLKANNARVEDTFENTAIIITEKDDVETAYLFVGGDTKLIGVLNGNDATVDGFGVRSDYYYTYDAEADKTSYYNQNGTLIAKVEGALEFRGYCRDGVLLVDEKGEWHKFVYDIIR